MRLQLHEGTVAILANSYLIVGLIFEKNPRAGLIRGTVERRTDTLVRSLVAHIPTININQICQYLIIRKKVWR